MQAFACMMRSLGELHGFRLIQQLLRGDRCGIEPDIRLTRCKQPAMCRFSEARSREISEHSQRHCSTNSWRRFCLRR